MNQEKENDLPKEHFVLKKLNEHIDALQKKTVRLKLIIQFLKVSIMLLGAASTILLGLSISNESYIEWSRNIAFVIGAVITFISSLSGTFDIEKFWITNKLILFQLNGLRDEYLFLDSREGGITEEQVSRIFYQYREAVKEKIEYWEKVAENQDKQKLVGQNDKTVSQSGSQPNIL